MHTHISTYTHARNNKTKLWLKPYIAHFQVKPVSCQTIPLLDDQKPLTLVPNSDLSAVLRSQSFRRATSEYPLVVNEESITPFNTWNFNETPV